MEEPIVIEGAVQPAQEGPVAPAAPVHGANPLDLPSDIFRAGLDRRRANRAALIEWIRSALVEGVDFGVIRRGSSKPSLWKPGAEKICALLGVAACFPSLRDYEQAALSGVALEHIVIRCELRDSAGRVVAEGVGARSLRQDSGDLNKALKMAEKSAMIDATLRMAGLSEIFTQDLEDMAIEPEPAPAPARAAPQRGAVVRITPAMVGSLEARIRALGLDRTRVLSWVMRAWGVSSFAELPRDKFEPLVDRLLVWHTQQRVAAAAAAAARAAETETEE